MRDALCLISSFEGTKKKLKRHIPFSSTLPLPPGALNVPKEIHSVPRMVLPPKFDPSNEVEVILPTCEERWNWLDGLKNRVKSSTEQELSPSLPASFNYRESMLSPHESELLIY